MHCGIYFIFFILFTKLDIQMNAYFQIMILIELNVNNCRTSITLFNKGFD